MCGLLYTNNPEIRKKDFISALEKMNHRGPDVKKCYENINFNKFGHNRLKILDLDSRSNQPMFSKKRDLLIVFNGEIYNFKELKEKYQINATTTSDTEILLELYSLRGYKMLDELNGMFAIVVYDIAKNELFVARDRLGIKPLYLSLIHI